MISPRPMSALVYVLACAAATVGVFCLGYASGPLVDYFDVSMYEAMAAGERAGLTEPFASRVLGPALARAIIELTGVQARTGLAIVGGASCALLAVLVPTFFFRQRVPLSAALGALLLPYTVVVVKYVHVPDALTVIIVFAFLWTLMATKRTPGPASLVFGILSILARKTLLVPYALLALYLASAKEAKKLGILCAAGVAGIAILGVIPTEASNIHEMNGISYYVLKLGANGIRNLLGVDLYTNTFQWCEDPVALFDVSFMPLIGAIREIGFCMPKGPLIVHTLVMYITVFGAWPALAVLYLRSKGEPEDPGRVTAGLFILFFFAAPLFGRTPERLFIYAYPFFLLVVAQLVAFARQRGIWGHFLRVSGGLQAVGVLYVLLL